MATRAATPCGGGEEVCAAHAADDAMVPFHDLVAPSVAAGLRHLRGRGWQVLVYRTM